MLVAVWVYFDTLPVNCFIHSFLDKSILCSELLATYVRRPQGLLVNLNKQPMDSDTQLASPGESNSARCMSIFMMIYKPGKQHQTGLVFGLLIGLCVVHAGLQVSACSGYDFATLVNTQTHTDSFWPAILLIQPKQLLCDHFNLTAALCIARRPSVITLLPVFIH